MAAKPATPNRAELETAWEDFQSRVFQCFTQLVWIVNIAPRLQDPRPHGRKLVANATVESSLLAVRDLDDFFSIDRERDGDIRASHYGYNSPGRFLTQDERNGINQKLVHLTYRAVRERLHAPDGPNPRQWDAANLVERAIAQVSPFLDFLEQYFFRGNASRIDDVQAARRGIAEFLGTLQFVAEIERAVFEADEE